MIHLRHAIGASHIAQRLGVERRIALGSPEAKLYTDFLKPRDRA